MSGLDGRSHSVGVATDGHNVAVGVDGGASHVLHQKQKAEREHNRMLEGAQVPAPLKKLKSTYDLAVEGMPERIRLAREIRSLFKPVDCYHPKYHKFRPSPEEQIARAFALTGDAKPYRLHRDLYSRLYDALQKSSVERAYIEAMWGDPYLHTVTHWAAIPQERRESLKKEYPEMQDLAEEVEEDRRDFLDKFDNFNDTPAGQFLNNMGFALSAVASVHPVGGVAVGAAQVGVRIAAGLPKVVKAITALGAVEIAREFSILCNKKSGGDPKARTIPTHNAQRDFIDAKVKSGEWTKMKGRFMFEDKKGRRFAPTKEKFEFEVGKKVDGVWQHIGIMRAEGDGAGKILKEFAKGKSAGHYFE